MDNSKLWEEMKKWCQPRGIRTDGVLVMTVQRNRSTQFASLVLDMEVGRVLPNYPMELLASYDETRSGEYLVCYKAGLAVLPSFSSEQAVDASSPGQPFGCLPTELTPYKHRRTAHDQAFNDFVRGEGHHPNLVFEVKKQVRPFQSHNSSPQLWFFRTEDV